MLDGWKDLFREHILERGRNYFHDGAVTELRKTENGYRAEVEGTEDYEVEIAIRNGQIYDMFCSCPYAEDGNYCKHMAAVLYQLESQNGSGTDTEETWLERKLRLQRELEETIREIPEDELRTLIKELADREDDIRNMLLTRYSVKIGASQMNRLKAEMDSLVYEYSDRSGFIDYRNAWDFAAAVTDFLEERVETLIDRECYGQAFELTCYVFQKAGNTSMDDSNGESSMIADTCYEKWKEILENCSDEEREKMKQWFVSHRSRKYVVDYLEEYLEEFLADELGEVSILKEKLALLDKAIEQRGDSTDCGITWSVHGGYQNNILERLEIMQRLNYSEKEIEEYKKKNRRFSTIRQLEIQESLEQEDFERAARVLKESKKLDSDQEKLRAQYSEQLLDIYERQADQKAYREELLYYVFQCRQKDLTYIGKLKSICTDQEWEQYREKILESDYGYNIRYSLLETEGLYRRMLEEIKTEGLIYSLDRHEKMLKEKFPEEVRDIYISYVYEEARRAGNRKAYRNLMGYLKKIRRYPEGKEKVREIASNWRAVYYRRPAMMDEMRKAGI